MAYVSKDKKAKIAEQIKAVMPKGWKYSLTVLHYSTIKLRIMQAPINLLEFVNSSRKDNGYCNINESYVEKYFDGELKEIFENFVKALNSDNYDKSDLMTDYFNVGHYVDLGIGKFEKPFVYKPE